MAESLEAPRVFNKTSSALHGCMDAMRCSRTLLFIVFLTLSGRITRAAEIETTRVAIDPGARQGTWEGWGTSLAWWAAVFGDDKELADALFTTKAVRINNTLLPGLGMNIVRYNAGACGWREVNGRSMAVSKIIHRYRQMEGFWLDARSSDPGSDSWDWSVDAKQRNMLALARDRGATHFELFSNSPMWWMTRNSNPSGGPKPSDDNLAPEHERNHAIYLATIARRAADQWGIHFTTVSPFNEPRSDWWFADCKQEGCHFSVEAQARSLPLLREELDKRGLQKLPIAASEETYYDHAIGTWERLDEKTRALIGQVNVHGYQEAKGNRAKLHKLVHLEGGKPLWNSEYGDGDPSGLNMARNLHRDLAALCPTSWSYWQPVDGGGWGLIAGDMREGRMQRINPKWFVLAHYTRHIPRGAIMLTTKEESVIAAYDERSGKLAIICLNDSEKEREFQIDLSGFASTASTASSWLTEPRERSRYELHEKLPLSGKLLDQKLPKKSVRSFVLEARPERQ
ncbi:glycoside hydrolase [Luteolibacter luteus]|uniref:Beta-1,6-galactanase n=1 Tax=Luteolibacter luteus TaxID=2728835 RepID=A0A858RKI1_9BACT|nr:glycoside hydrolase [Luteolibacter luteus]QJE97245.1 beta-1,6-galactanase [Luteolibacter luteus]